MRRLVTFVVRLWVDPREPGPAWEGQVECVGTGERAHVRGADELARFVEVQMAENRAEPPGHPAAV